MTQVGFPNQNAYQVDLFRADAVKQFVSISSHVSYEVHFQPKSIGFIMGERVALPILNKLGDMWNHFNQTSSSKRFPIPGPVETIHLQIPTPGPVEKSL